MKIEIFFNFKEENRVSMNMLGNMLFKGFKDIKKEKVYKFIPRISFLSKLNKNLFTMRFERYVNYPLQVLFKRKKDVVHIIDHQYSHLVDFINAKVKIITINDLIPIIFKKKRDKNPLLLKYSLSRIKKFDHIVSLSKQTKKDLIKFFKIDQKKISVIYPPVGKIFNTKKVNKYKLSKKFNLPVKQKKIIVYDTIFYKNFEFSLSLFKLLLKFYPNVIMIKIGSNYKKNINPYIRDKIYEFEKLNRSEIANLYKICDLLLFPSIYEGFGLPCLEAMKCGIPVLGSNKASLKEVLNKSSQFSFSSKLTVVKKIIKIFKNKKYFNKYSKLSIIQSKKFNESYYFEKMNNLYLKHLN